MAQDDSRGFIRSRQVIPEAVPYSAECFSALSRDNLLLEQAEKLLASVDGSEDAAPLFAPSGVGAPTIVRGDQRQAESDFVPARSAICLRRQLATPSLH